MDNEKDLLMFTDEDGHEVPMEVLDYFEYDGDEYALLTIVDDENIECDDEECDCDNREIYIMKVVNDGDTEEFLPVEEDKINEIIDALQEEDLEDLEDLDGSEDLEDE